MRGENAIQESFSTRRLDTKSRRVPYSPYSRYRSLSNEMHRLDDICFLIDLVCVDKREVRRLVGVHDTIHLYNSAQVLL